MTAPATPKVTWRAGADKIRHAHAPRATRTLCGIRIVAENLDHRDARDLCPTCQAKLQPDRLAL